MQCIDEWSIEYLQIIQHMVIRYWNGHGHLPWTLRTALEEALRNLPEDPMLQHKGFWQLPRNSKTGVSFEYRFTGAQSFELCTTIEQERIDPGMMLPIWPLSEMNSANHKGGRLCLLCSIAEDNAHH
jgi:hypothetical protein